MSDIKTKGTKLRKGETYHCSTKDYTLNISAKSNIRMCKGEDGGIIIEEDFYRFDELTPKAQAVAAFEYWVDGPFGPPKDHKELLEVFMQCFDACANDLHHYRYYIDGTLAKGDSDD